MLCLGQRAITYIVQPIEGGQLRLVGQPDDAGFTDSNVVNGKKYYYTVTAVTDNGESPLSEYGAATPLFPINDVVITKQSDEVTLGVGNKTSEIEVTIDIPGLTDDEAYAGKEAPNVIARLAFYKDGTSKAIAEETKLRYKSDTEDGKKYTGRLLSQRKRGPISILPRYPRITVNPSRSLMKLR